MKCLHQRVQSWVIDGTGEPAGVWRCVDCGHDFAPIDAPKDNDAARIEWLNGAIFMPKWNGVIGSGSEVNWTIAGDWRHTCARMTGNDFRAAIDAAMAKPT